MTKTEADQYTYDALGEVVTSLQEGDPYLAIDFMDTGVYELLEHGYFKFAWQLIDDTKYELNNYWNVEWGID